VFHYQITRSGHGKKVEFWLDKVLVNEIHDKFKVLASGKAN
jgi:hypothetical protein